MTSYALRFAAAVFVVLAMVGGVIFYYWSGDYADFTTSVMKDIIFFTLSAGLSYWLAITVSRSEYKRELAKLGNISVRRVSRLSENIREISRSLRPVDEQSANELSRIARDADETTSDILLITETDHGAPSAQAIFCPACGFKDQVVMPEGAGASMTNDCRHCGTKYNLHNVRVGIKIKEIPSANQGHSPSTSQPQVKATIQCPNLECECDVHVNRAPGYKKVYCFECYHSFIYNFDDDRISNVQSNDILDTGKSITDIELVTYAICPKVDCMAQLKDKSFFIRNSRGERFAKCRACSSTVKADAAITETDAEGSVKIS